MGANPLVNKRVVVTRPEPQVESLCRLLRGAGAVPVRFPTIRLVPAADKAPLRSALVHLLSYDWVVFTSVNGVRYVLDEAGGTWPVSVKVAAIGPATRAALERRGVAVRYMPEEYRAERIADGIDSGRILLLRAQGARPALRGILRARGAEVDEVPVYAAEVNRPTHAAFEDVAAGVDVLTFTSASTVRAFAQLVGAVPTDAVCIGPITASAAEALGFRVRAVAKDYTIEGLVDAIKTHYA